MSGYVCTIANRKGGVGKTTSTVNLGAAFTRAGYDTVVIDADLEMPNLAGTIGLDVDQTIHDVLTGDAVVSEAVTTTTDGLAIVPGDQALEAYADVDTVKHRKVVEPLKRSHDIVFVDTGPGLCQDTTSALKLADGVILPITPDEISIDDARMTGELVEKVDGTVVGGLLTRLNEEPNFEAIESRLEYPVLGTDPLDEKLHPTEPVVQESPDSDRADAMERLVDRLEGVLFHDIDPDAVQTVYESEWVDEDGTDEEDDETEEADTDDYSHAVFQGI